MNLNSPRQAAEREVAVQEARSLVDTIADIMGQCDDIIGFSEGALQEISDLLEKEDKLLSGLYKSDSERRRNLK